MCPVWWYRLYTKVLSQGAVFLFHPIGEPLGQLSKSTPNFTAKKALRAIGVDAQNYGSHSCRKGGCTAAVEAGVDLRKVSKHGRWKSNAVEVYVKDSLDSKLAVTRAMF